MRPKISLGREQNNRLCLNPNFTKFGILQMCWKEFFLLHHTGYSWIAFDRVSLKLIKHILWSQCASVESIEIVRFNLLSPTSPFAMLIMLSLLSTA